MPYTWKVIRHNHEGLFLSIQILTPPLLLQINFYSEQNRVSQYLTNTCFGNEKGQVGIWLNLEPTRPPNSFESRKSSFVEGRNLEPDHMEKTNCTISQRKTIVCTWSDTDPNTDGIQFRSRCIYLVRSTCMRRTGPEKFVYESVSAVALLYFIFYFWRKTENFYLFF